ncbi:MAG: hypothetical protein ABIP51_13935 [Bacteroidia bacterium]
MKYKSIDEVTKDFGINSTNIGEIKKELRQILKDIHPDKNGDKFKSKLDEINYHKILNALEFFEQEFALVTKAELMALTTIIKDSSSPLKEQKQIEVLEKKIDALVKTYKESNYAPKISSAAISVIITFLWLFPTTIKEHPVLTKFISPSSLIFTVVWLYSLFITGVYWLSTKRRENRIEDATKKLNLESIQNRLFDIFMKSNLTDKGIEDISFSKDELISFLTELDFFNLTHNSYNRQANPFELLLLMGRINRNISLDLAQTLADIIIERAKKKNIIHLKIDHSLADTYEYKTK